MEIQSYALIDKLKFNVVLKLVTDFYSLHICAVNLSLLSSYEYASLEPLLFLNLCVQAPTWTPLSYTRIPCKSFVIM